MLLCRPIGEYEVITINDGSLTFDASILIHTGNRQAQDQLANQLSGRKIVLDVNHFALRGPNGISLIDAGTGSDDNPDIGKARNAMRSLGILPESVDRIFMTHLHFDHALGLLDSDDAYFKRAEILVPAVELAFYSSEVARLAMPEARQAAFSITDRILKAYAGRVRCFLPGTIASGITAISLPGHTMGHTGFILDGNDEKMLFCGDVLHESAIQARDPDVSTIYDYDPELAARSRRWTLERASEESWIVAGSHFTGLGKVNRLGSSFEILKL